MHIDFIDIKFKKDKRGNLGIIEYKNLPFKIKRTYFLNKMPLDAFRAGHAHKKLNQLIICLNGKAILKLCDGIKTKKIILNKNSDQCLWLKPGLWREIVNLHKETVLMVLASESFEVKDYIRDFNLFLKFISINK